MCQFLTAQAGLCDYAIFVAKSFWFFAILSSLLKIASAEGLLYAT